MRELRLNSNELIILLKPYPNDGVKNLKGKFMKMLKLKIDL